MNLEDVPRVIGSKVRAARAEAAISRKRLAEMAGVSERYLNQLEQGVANASIGILARWPRRLPSTSSACCRQPLVPVDRSAVLCMRRWPSSST